MNQMMLLPHAWIVVVQVLCVHQLLVIPLFIYTKLCLSVEIMYCMREDCYGMVNKALYNYFIISVSSVESSCSCKETALLISCFFNLTLTVPVTTVDALGHFETG